MKRKVFVLFVLSFIAFCTCVLVACDHTTDDDTVTEDYDWSSFWCYDDGEGGVYIDAYRGDARDLDIPEYYYGKPVRSISENAFEDRLQLRSIKLPDTLVEIGEGAFSGCFMLNDIVFPDSLRRVGRNALEDTSWYYNVPDGVVYTGNVAYTFKGEPSGVISLREGTVAVAEGAFEDMTAVTSIEVPDSVSVIGEHAFHGTAWFEAQPSGCVYLGKALYFFKYDPLAVEPDGVITVAPSATYVADGAFAGVNRITEVVLPDGLKSIGIGAFEECYGLKVADIPDSVTELGESAFRRCSSLVQVLLGDGITTIPNRTFSGCSALVFADFNNVTVIGSSAFESCDMLRVLNIPEQVVNIGEYAFSYCENLRSASLPSTLARIDSGIFFGCYKLTNLTISDRHPIYRSVNNCIIDPQRRVLVLGCTGSVIPTDGSVTSLGNLSFYGSGVRDVEIPSCVTLIESGAFNACGLLERCKLPSSVSVIPVQCFSGCDSLREVVIPESVTTIEHSAFSKCTALREIVIPESVKTIEHSAFEECTALERVDLPSGLEHLANTAFLRCEGEFITEIDGVRYVDGWAVAVTDKSRTTLTLAEGTTGVADYIFSVMSELVSVVLPEGLKALSYGMFSGCISLEEVRVPNSVKAIYAEAFRICGADIVWGDSPSVEVIAEDAFQNYLGESLVIPDSVTVTETSAIHHCDNLKSLTLGKGVRYLPDAVVWACDALERIYFNGTVGEWNAIGKEYSWCRHYLEVHCLDGVVAG